MRRDACDFSARGVLGRGYQEGLDQYLEWNRGQRKVNRPEVEE